MHKLDRTETPPPACLAAQDSQVTKWENFNPTCKHELRAALVLMQGQPSVTTPGTNQHGLRCAYCESYIYNDRHIEHFYPKSRFPERTFDWNNLFYSCGSNQHCGHYKDRKHAPIYDPKQIIKPDEHEPDDYLFFHSSGEVRARSNLDKDDKDRAEITIKVFGLNNPELKGKRTKALSLYKNKILKDLDELSSWSSDDRQAYLTDEIEITCHEPYATTIKHFLQSF